MLPLLMLVWARRCLPWVLVASLAPGAIAATPKGPPPKDEAPPEEPLSDDLGNARTLRPPPGGLSGVIEESKEPEAPTPEREVSTIVVHGRVVTMPGFVLGAFFSHYQSLTNPSLGVGYEWGDLNSSMWAVELDWSSLVTDAGNWLESGKGVTAGNYAENGLQLISVDAMYRKQLPISDRVRAMVGGGLGLGVLVGNIDTAEVLPTCTAPVGKCAHWPSATNGKADLPTRIVPVVHIAAGLEVDVTDGFTLRLQAGFRDLFYAGLSAAKTF